ncbi:MAG TPA: Rid family detoxifying hydrolase [Longimicrobiales bacterium]|nr:Rid family detoxifying hydrolase [Longimicrobiales bacterium]
MIKLREFIVLTGALALGACASAQTARRESINPPGATRLGPYSTAVRTGSLVFFSGVIGMRPAGAGLPEGTEAQARQALENLRSNLTLAGLTPRDVVKCTVFLVDMADYQVVNQVYGQFFTEDPPARSAVAVAALPANARIEIECIAAQ